MGQLIRGLHCPWTSWPSEGATLPSLGTSLSPLSHTDVGVRVLSPPSLALVAYQLDASTQELSCRVGSRPHRASGGFPYPGSAAVRWHGRSWGSPGRGPSGASVEVGQSVAGGSDQPVRGVMLTQAPHRYVRRSITPGGVTVRLTHRPPQPNPSKKKKANPVHSLLRVRPPERSTPREAGIP